MIDEAELRFQADLRRIGEGYCMFILCTIGTIGNLLAFVTFSRKGVKGTSTTIYLRALALADIGVLITAIFRYKTYKLFLDDDDDLDSVFHLDGYVEVYVEPVHWVALGSSSFITIALSIERFLAVKYPLFIKRKCSSCLVLAIIWCVVVTSVVLTVPNYASYKIVHFDFFGTDVAVAMLTDYGHSTLYPCTYHNYMVPILWYVVPAIVLSVMNILLSLHVRTSTRIRVGLPNLANPNRHLTTMIILIVAAYIGCNLPKCGFMFYKLVTSLSDHHECADVTSHVISPKTRVYLSMEVVTELLNVLNSCMNIVVYCLIGTRFRKELIQVLKCKWGRDNRLRHFTNSKRSSTFRRTLSSRYNSHA